MTHTAENDASQWGKKRPGNYFDQYADWCGNRTPHPRHGWRGFAGGHNTESLWCLGTAMPARAPETRVTPPEVTEEATR